MRTGEDLLRGLRNVGVATLVMAVGAVITGVWWVELSAGRAGVLEEQADIAVTSSQLDTTEVAISQAVALSPGADAGSIERLTFDDARRAAEDAVARLATRELVSPRMTSDLMAYVREGDAVVTQLAAGDADGARDRSESQLAGRRGDFFESEAARSQVLDARLEELDDLLPIASTVVAVAVGMLSMGLIAVVWLAWNGPVPDPDSGAGTHIVIQLPTGPNPPSPGRRFPKVGDLGWLIGQIARPFEERGWEMAIRCPSVGVDCDPADVREVMSSLIGRAESSGAERIGLIVKPSGDRIRVVVADDGEPIFGPQGFLSGSEPVLLKSALRTRTEAATAELRWARLRDVNFAILDMPRLDRAHEPVSQVSV